MRLPKKMGHPVADIETLGRPVQFALTIPLDLPTLYLAHHVVGNRTAAGALQKRRHATPELALIADHGSELREIEALDQVFDGVLFVPADESDVLGGKLRKLLDVMTPDECFGDLIRAGGDELHIRNLVSLGRAAHDSATEMPAATMMAAAAEAQAAARMVRERRDFI